MAFTQIMEGGRYVVAQKEFVCDEAADLEAILNDYDGILPIGTKAHVVNSGVQYILDSEGEWVEQPSSGGSSGGGADVTTFTPAASLFAEILPGQGDTDIGEWVQPDNTNPYMAGDRVIHNGVVWESTADNNVWEPGVYGWVQVE